MKDSFFLCAGFYMYQMDERGGNRFASEADLTAPTTTIYARDVEWQLYEALVVEGRSISSSRPWEKWKDKEMEVQSTNIHVDAYDTRRKLTV